MSTNYQKQIAKNKGAVISTFVVAFFATYVVMGGGGFSLKSAEVAVVPQGTEEAVAQEQLAQVSSVSTAANIPVITSYAIFGYGSATSTLVLSGSGFSTTSNMVTICRVTETGACASRRSDVIFIYDVRAFPDSATSSKIVFNLPRTYSNGTLTRAYQSHLLAVYNKTTKKYSGRIRLQSLLHGDQIVPAAIWTLVSAPGPIVTRPSYLGATSTITAQMTFRVRAQGGTLLKPNIRDFGLAFVSSLSSTSSIQNATKVIGAGYPGFYSIIDSISPSDSSVGDGGEYLVTVKSIFVPQRQNQRTELVYYTATSTKAMIGGKVYYSTGNNGKGWRTTGVYFP